MRRGDAGDGARMMRDGAAIRDVLYAAGGMPGSVMPGDRAVFGTVALDGFARAFGSCGRGMTSGMDLMTLDRGMMSRPMSHLVPVGGQRGRGRSQPTGQHERRGRIEKTHGIQPGELREHFQSSVSLRAG